MVRGGLSLEGLSKEVQKKLRLPPDIPTDLQLTASTAKDEHNPHSFYVTLSGPLVLGSVKVKIELWRTDAKALKSLEVKVSTVANSSGQAFVPTLTLHEIFADKVYALGARNRIKPRDVFDLWWLCEKEKQQLSMDALRTRLHIYPDAGGNVISTAAAWLVNAGKRLKELKAPSTAKYVSQDLKRWLPSSWRVDEKVSLDMVQLSIAYLEAGIELMREFALPSKGKKK